MDDSGWWMTVGLCVGKDSDAPLYKGGLGHLVFDELGASADVLARCSLVQLYCGKVGPCVATAPNLSNA